MPRGGARSLVLWSWVVLVLVALHDVTHVLDDGLETPRGQLALVAVPQWLVLIVLMVIMLRGDRIQRSAALVLGLSVMAGFAAVHLVPVSPAAYWELQPSVVSWVLAWAPAGAALVLATLAWRWRPAAPATRRLADPPQQSALASRGRPRVPDRGPPRGRRPGRGATRRFIGFDFESEAAEEQRLAQGQKRGFTP